jgi:hypothetical protein
MFFFVNSVILDFFNIRKSRDIDILTNKDSTNYLNVDNLIKHISFYGQPFNELAYNSNNYYEINSIKLITLERLKSYKQTLIEKGAANLAKDKYDVALISSVLQNNKTKNLINITSFKKLIVYRFYLTKINLRMASVAIKKNRVILST